VWRIVALDGTGVRLRPWRATDVAPVEAVRSDPIVSRWSSLPDETATAWLDRQRTRTNGVSLAITELGMDAAVGKAALGNYDPHARRAELSYWVIPERRGRGLATAACRALCRWGFESVCLSAILLDIEVDNEPSSQVARALGASPGPLHAEVDRSGISRQLVLWTAAAQ